MHKQPIRRSVNQIVEVLQSERLSDVLRYAGDDKEHKECRVDVELGRRVKKVVAEFVWALDRGVAAQIKWNGGNVCVFMGYGMVLTKRDSARRGRAEDKTNLANAKLMEWFDMHP
jgi:hypothetical protein